MKLEFTISLQHLQTAKEKRSKSDIKKNAQEIMEEYADVFKKLAK